ncbi:MAG: DNA polymerase III subunit gamma/tau [Clostridia bacterium]|nr:DNA polymerase III subunit gamma/tau [Clostridia bacterium]
MGYIALYRKYRPNTFSSIIGQENVTKILKNQIKNEKISHAYLFSGTRGTGKTSAAKVFARAINCLNPKDGEPCNECDVCKGILNGNITDVIEMDAASNNSVENIRQIRQEVVYATVDVKYRVYIIDEVHMLTTSAFNALLKTLEEPPANVVFILATTEQHKIPVTILSRCLKFEFNRLSEVDLYKRIKFVLESENVEYEDEACKYIATLADGAARDALSILDRCISETDGILKYEDVQNIVGAIDKKIINQVADSMLDYDYLKALEAIDQVIKKGKDLRQFTFELTNEFLNRLVDSQDKNTDRYAKIIDRLSSLDNDLKSTTRKEIVLKACIVQLCNLKEATSTASSGAALDEAYVKKIQALENRINELQEFVKNNKVSGESAKPADVPNINVTRTTSTGSKPDVDVEKLTEFPNTEELKKAIVEKGKIKVFSALAGAKIYIDDVVRIITKNAFAYNILKTDESVDAIAMTLYEKYKVNKNMVLELRGANDESISKIEKVLKDNNIEYTNLD